MGRETLDEQHFTGFRVRSYVVADLNRRAVVPRRLPRTILRHRSDSSLSLQPRAIGPASRCRRSAPYCGHRREPCATSMGRIG
jgi:hypothetical protein